MYWTATQLNAFISKTDNYSMKGTFKPAKVLDNMFILLD